jgi:hypothetical protein
MHDATEVKNPHPKIAKEKTCRMRSQSCGRPVSSHAPMSNVFAFINQIAKSRNVVEL